MKDLFFLERKSTTEELPLLDQPITALRLIGLCFTTLIAFSIYFLLVLNFSSNSELKSSSYAYVGIFLAFICYWLLTTQSPLRLYQKPSWRDFKVGFLFLIALACYSSIISMLLRPFAATTTNQATAIYQKLPQTLSTVIYILFENFGSLMLEEVVSIFLFLAITALLVHYLKRSTAILISLILSSLIFGALHFYAYNFHFAQMFLLIGGERLFLTGAYLRTRNIWVSFLMHYILDVLPFVIIVLIPH